MKSIVICPNCKQVLFKKNAKSFCCKNGHCFDIAKEGYVNLVLPNKKKSKSPGDDKEMVVSRANFLNSGFYVKLAKEVNKIVNSCLKSEDIILDAGCGTGYYLEQIDGDYFKIGIDVSKEAIRYAAKHDKNIFYAVASIFDLPILNNSIDCILNIFAPKPNDEFLRILKPNGVVVEVIPGKNHLIELKKVLYQEPHYNKEDVKEYNLECEETRQLKYKLTLNNEELMELFKMTPYNYKTTAQDVEKLKGIEEFVITCDFIIKVWRR